MPLLSVRDLTVEFPTRRGLLRALDRVSFDIDAGEVLGVVGESGAGKSLTGAAIIGLLEPPGRIAGGEIVLGGQRIDNLHHEAMRHIRGKQIGTIFQDPLTIDDYLAQPYLVEPLRRADICMISDGGACLIVTDAHRLPEGAPAPVYVLGTEQVTSLRQYQNPDNLLRPWVSAMAEPVFHRAGITREEIDVLFVQDPTSVWVLQMLELFGYCGVGESGPYVAEGRIALGGES